MSAKFHGRGPQDIGLTGAAVALALLETMVAKGLLSRNEARDLLEIASAELGGLRSVNGDVAAATIRERFLPLFAEERGDQA